LVKFNFRGKIQNFLKCIGERWKFMDILPDNNEVLSIDVCHPFFGNSCVAGSGLNRGETNGGSLLLPGSSFWWIQLWSCCEEEEVRLDQLLSHAGTTPPYIFLSCDAYTSP
jgi:hypothetical protein